MKRLICLAAVTLALLTCVACSRGTLREPLIPGKGTATLKMGESTVDQTLAVLGEHDGAARENSTTTSGANIESKTTYQQLADVHYDDGVTVTFSGESATPLLDGPDVGTSGSFKLFREKNMGRLDMIEVKATSKGAPSVRTDKGLALGDPQARVKELYGQPAAARYSQYEGPQLLFAEGLVITLDKPKDAKGDVPRVVTRIAVRKPFTDEELRDRLYRRDFSYE